MTEFKDALIALRKKDPNLGRVIELIKPEYNKKEIDEFESLVKIIIGQQLSGSAARTIVRRIENYLKEKKITPIVISSVNQEDLRLCGISNAKIAYIKGLSNILIENPNYFINLKKNTANNILEELCKIKGIGIWTASIFAMGTLNYENIFPYGDATLIKAIKNIYGEKICTEKVISAWSPYKSFGSRILWQWVDRGMPRIN